MAADAQFQLAAAPERLFGPVPARLALRFALIYFALFCAGTQVLVNMLPIPDLGIPELYTTLPFRAVIFPTANHVFHAKLPLVFEGSGSGDKTYDWVFCFCSLVIAAVAAGLWTLLSERTNDTAVYKWFRLFLRIAVGTEMLLYGSVKVIPLQMPFPFLTKLLEPFGNFSPMGALWFSVGASPAYEMFVGAAEMTGGLLLLFPRTAMLGALISLADITEVFTLNMTYDVPVKLLSLHILLMLLVILAPDMKRILQFFLTSNGAGPSTAPPLFASARRNRIAGVTQVVYAFIMLAMFFHSDYKAWHQYGAGAPKSELYGIWNIEQRTVDGKPLLAAATDTKAWRRIVFDRPGSMAIQLMSDGFANCVAQIDPKASVIGLSKGAATGTLRFQRPDPQHLTLDGTLDQHAEHLELSLVDRNKLMLVSRGFHWIQEYPFNR